MSETKEVSVYNKGARTFRSGKVKLEPGRSVVVSEDVAKTLLCYPECMETGKVPPRDTRSAQMLRAENDKLKAEMAELKKASAVESEEPVSEKAEKGKGKK
jgi:hypothetical protein